MFARTASIVLLSAFVMGCGTPPAPQPPTPAADFISAGPPERYDDVLKVVPAPLPKSKPTPKKIPYTPPVTDSNSWNTFPLVDPKGVVLSFDDGPSPQTAQLIQTLNREQVPAVFFWNTYHLYFANNEVVTLIKSSPIIIGDHTVDHPDMNQLGYEKQYNEIVTAQKAIETRLGRPVIYYRPPYGNWNRTTAQVLASTHITNILWTDDSLDWKYNSNEQAILQTIKSELRPGAVILMHDHPYTIKFLPDIIQMIRSQGYTFTTLQTPN